MQERASLGDAVHKVPDFTDAQKDSIKALEKRYGEVFKSYGIAMRIADGQRAKPPAASRTSARWRCCA